MRRRPKSPEERLAELTPEQAQARARESALRMLGAREHSAAQLKRKLSSRGHGGERAETVLDELQTAGWQSDARFAESLARSRAAQGYGPLRIRAELEAAAVGAAEARAAMDALKWDFTAAACRLQARHFHEPPAGAAEWNKQYRYLAGRGFETAQIRAALRGGRDPEEDPGP